MTALLDVIVMFLSSIVVLTQNVQVLDCATIAVSERIMVHVYTDHPRVSFCFLLMFSESVF